MTVRPCGSRLFGGVLVSVVGMFAATGVIVPTRVANAEIGVGRRLCLSVGSDLAGDLAVVNLTPVNATAPGFGVLISSDVSIPPTASNVNFAAGTVDPNVAVAPIGIDGFVCFSNSDHTDVDLVADLLAVLSADATTPTSTGAAVRLVDTRIGLAGTQVTPGERRCFPSGATPGDLAVINLTPVNATAPGFGALTSSDITTAPTASNVNFAPGTVDPNLAITPIGSDGRVCYHNSTHATIDLIADLLTTIHQDEVTPTSTGAAVRVADTRVGLAGTQVTPGERRCFPSGATPGDLAIVNLTPVNATAPGYGALTSSDIIDPPTASNVNFAPGTVDPNLAITPIGTDGRLCYHNSTHATIDLIADLLATIHQDAQTWDGSRPYRLVDTRPERRDSVTCPTATRCYAAGDQFYVSDDFGVTWQLSETGVNLEGLDSGSVRCFGADVCSFFGFRLFGLMSYALTYVTIDGGQTWRTPGAVNNVLDVSCPSGDTCLVVGNNTRYGPPFGSTRRAVVSNDVGRTWRSIPLPPVAGSLGTTEQLKAVACTSSTECSAISVVPTAGGDVTTLVSFVSSDGWNTVTVTER